MKFRRITIGEAAAILAPLVASPKTDTSRGVCGVMDWIGGGYAYQFLDATDRPLVVFAFQYVDREHGRVLEVTAARQLVAGAHLTETVLPYIEKAFGRDCVAVSIHTRRPGLVSKLEGAGYEQAATIMHKKLKG